MDKRQIDINADVGEGCGNDAALFALVTSANIACGWHAGDETTMRETVRSARDRGVAIGAHPSYPDRENFGRTSMQRSADAVYDDVIAQVQALAAIAAKEGAKLHHVKPHGALYNDAARDAALAQAIARAVRDFDPGLALYGLAGSAIIREAQRLGLRAAGEIFADRRYTADGQLVPRGTPGALIDDCGEAVEQTLVLLERGAETICVHGDGPHAVAFAREIYDALSSAGIAMRTY